MPIREYTCGSCGAQVEVFQKMSERAKRVCPACGDNTLVKKISAGNFILKGDGWTK